MKSSKFWIAVAVSGVVMNIIDYVIQAMVMTNLYYSKHPDVFLDTSNPAWFIVGDFVTVLVLAWVYNKVAASFSTGWKGGAMYGLYAGVLINFPTWIIVHLFMKGVSYKFAWFSTIYGIVWSVVAAAILAALFKKGEASA